MKEINAMSPDVVLLTGDLTEDGLILCGHRQGPWRWHVEKMKIVHAGSLSCEKLRGFFCNSYNVITVKKNQIEERLKIVGGDFVDFSEIVKMREVLQASDISS